MQTSAKARQTFSTPSPSAVFVAFSIALLLFLLLCDPKRSARLLFGPLGRKSRKANSKRAAI